MFAARQVCIYHSCLSGRWNSQVETVFAGVVKQPLLVLWTAIGQVFWQIMMTVKKLPCLPRGNSMSLRMPNASHTIVNKVRVKVLLMDDPSPCAAIY